MTTTTLTKLEQITIDTAIQLKARDIDSHTVGAYIEAISGGAKLPPVVIYFDGQCHWLADGFHRVSAYRFLGVTEIDADVRDGTRQDALVFAAISNVANGRPMNQAEKREAGERLLKLTSWSDVEIARRLAVGKSSVQRWRELSCPFGQDTQRTVTRNGTTYQMNTNGIHKTVYPLVVETSSPRIDTRPLFDDPQLDAALEDETKFICLECGEVFDHEVWHCPECNHHWPMNREDCQNCHSYTRPESFKLICGDFRDECFGIEDGSIDVIITDPPYPREFIELYGYLASQAARILRPGGSLLAMCGQSYLPEILSLMTPHLNYQWTDAYLTPGGQSPQIWQRKVNTFWKPVLWFVKGEYTGKWHGDVIKSDVNDNDKRYHHWGQSESGIFRLVDDYSKPGDLILDPFVGGGTTALAALALNRRFIGVDNNEQALEITRQRIAEYAGQES